MNSGILCRHAFVADCKRITPEPISVISGNKLVGSSSDVRGSRFLINAKLKPQPTLSPGIKFVAYTSRVQDQRDAFIVLLLNRTYTKPVNVFEFLLFYDSPTTAL